PSGVIMRRPLQPSIGKAVTNERKCPYIVEISVADDKLDVEFSRRIMGFHRSRKIEARHGRRTVSKGQIYCYCVGVRGPSGKRSNEHRYRRLYDASERQRLVCRPRLERFSLAVTRPGPAQVSAPGAKRGSVFDRRRFLQAIAARDI